MDDCTGITSGAPELIAEAEGGALYRDQGLKVACLYGDWEQMGRQWGALGRDSMAAVLSFIEDKISGSEKRIEEFRLMAERVWSHYPAHLKRFMEAAAETSGLGISNIVYINGVEWGEPSFFLCSGIACWGDYSRGELVYGRNYDAMSFRPLGPEMVLMVFHPTGAQSFATLGYAGEIYCLNGFNESGLFVELNNGTPSTGRDINFDISLSTTELMRLIAEAHTLEDADKFFAGTPSASGFLIGVADSRSARCYEWYADKARRSDNTTPEGLMAMTNHYLDPEWGYADPAEESCWNSHARRRNMVRFAEGLAGSDSRSVDDCVEALKKLMRLPIEQGGPSMPGLDMYQLVVIPGQHRFYLNIPETPVTWSEIRLDLYF